VNNHFRQNYKIYKNFLQILLRKVFYTKYFARKLVAISYRKFFTTKFVSIFYERKLNKIDKKYEFFSSVYSVYYFLLKLWFTFLNFLVG